MRKVLNEGVKRHGCHGYRKQHRTYLPRMAHTVLSGRNDLYRYGDSLEIVTPPAIRDFLGIGIRREIPIVSKQE